MSLRSAVLAGRRAAMRTMLDTATVRAVAGVATDPLTGAVTPTYSAALYTGRCKVQSSGLQAATSEAAGHMFTVQDYRVDFPVGSFVPVIGLVVTIDVATLDPNLVGRVFRVTSLLHKSQATAYRLGVEQVVG
jgi:hypothetical protein